MNPARLPKRVLCICLVPLLLAACSGTTPAPTAAPTGVPAAASPAPSAPPPAAARGKIAFVSTRDGNGEIYVMNADGSDPRRLTKNTRWDGSPAWSPDGTQIAYYTHLTEQAWAIMVMDADGGNPRQLTEGNTCGCAPFWSPDGSRIVFTADLTPTPTCETRSGEIAMINADGSDYHLLTENDFNDLYSPWSPDGVHILFHSDRDGDEELYVMNADGSDVRQVTDNAAKDVMPAWSPDSRRILFVSDRDGDDEVYVMNADGSDPVRITDHRGPDWFPVFSPDGRQILFTSQRGSTSMDLFVMDAGGSNVRQLTSAPGEEFSAAWQR